MPAGAPRRRLSRKALPSAQASVTADRSNSSEGDGTDCPSPSILAAVSTFSASRCTGFTRALFPGTARGGRPDVPPDTVSMFQRMAFMFWNTVSPFPNIAFTSGCRGRRPGAAAATRSPIAKKRGRHACRRPQAIGCGRDGPVASASERGRRPERLSPESRNLASGNPHSSSGFHVQCQQMHRIHLSALFPGTARGGGIATPPNTVSMLQRMAFPRGCRSRGGPGAAAADRSPKPRKRGRLPLTRPPIGNFSTVARSPAQTNPEGDQRLVADRTTMPGHYTLAQVLLVHMHELCTHTFSGALSAVAGPA
jgi:hypothetical protein